MGETAHRIDAVPVACDAAGRLDRAAADLWMRAGAHDRDGADPVALCAPLRTHGLFVDVLPRSEGGEGLATDASAVPRLLEALMRIGAADLSAGRLFEGHVNAVKLVFRYGDGAQRAALARDVRAGAVCGVWNAEAPPGLALDGDPRAAGGAQLRGAKIYCSGLGLVTRPVVTARTPQGAPQMLTPALDAPPPHDLSGWTMRGMRATATGTVDFTGLRVGAAEALGGPGDYYRGPLFKGGAWRFAAVQTGAVSRLATLMRDALRERGRDGDPHQRARIGSAALAEGTAELWASRAAALAEDPATSPADVDAYVGLARLAVERAALEAIALAERAVGLAAFARPHPIERVVRDLSTYLRQPFPDGVLDEAAAHLSSTPGAPAWSLLAERAR